MTAPGRFPVAREWIAGVHVARVISVRDPQDAGRVQVQLTGPDPDRDALVWARVAVGFAGDNCGAFLIPDVDSEVLVVFPAGDAARPIVIGALWNGAMDVPERLPGDRVDRWTITGTNGTRIAIVEEGEGRETVEIATPAGAVARLTDAAGGEIRLEIGGHSITMGPDGVAVRTSAECSVQAASVSVTAASVDVQASLSTFSGVVQCDTLIANSVISTTYSPGAGNVW